MFKDVIDGFKRWMTCDEVYSILESTSKACDAFCAKFESLDSKVKQIEAAEKSRAEAMDFIASSAESIKPVCDDCVSMRLEMDALRSAADEMKARLDALETTWKGGVDYKPKRGRRRSDAKELVA